jgi:hypothetical protein
MTRKVSPWCVILFSLLLSGSAFSQSHGTLTNSDIESMAKQGFSPDVITAKIQSSQCGFDTSLPALEKLKTDSVPQSVIAAMVGAKCGAVPSADGKPRIFVTAESTRSSRWGFAAGRNGGGGGGVGGIDPQADEVIKTMHLKCPAVDVTTDRAAADYLLDMQREPNKGYLQKRNKWILTNRNGDVIAAGSVRSVGSVVKDTCQSMTGGQPHAN